MSKRFKVFAATAGRNVLIRVEGGLDAGSVRQLRETLDKVVLDDPQRLIVDVGKVVARDASAWSVFTDGCRRVDRWPDAPIALVCDDPQTRELLTRLGVSQSVSVYDSYHAASTATGGDRPPKPPTDRVSTSARGWTATVTP
jgi:anti-anti-sigma factor